jgi:hypothetical protein
MLKEIVNQGNKCIVLNIFESGSQHVDHIENQYIGANTKPTPIPSQGQPTPIPSQRGGEPRLPEVLATEEAVEIWKKVQGAGYVDAHYQPLLSRTQSALLADAIAERLGIREKWKTFETLWNRKNIRSDYNLALRQHQSLDFQDELKRIL